MKTIIKLIIGIAVILAGLSAGAASATQDTPLPADGVVSLEHTDAGWTITLQSADASEVKLISPTQSIACSEHEGQPKNGHPLCDSTTYTFVTDAECVMVQVDWTGNVHNSSDPRRCWTPTPPTPPMTPTPTPTSTPSMTPTATPILTFSPSPDPTATPKPTGTPGTPLPTTALPIPMEQLAATGGEWIPLIILALLLGSLGLAALIAQAEINKRPGNGNEDEK